MSQADDGAQMEFVNRALRGELVWNIGQLNRSTIAALNHLVGRGDLVKTRADWQSLCTKTVWTKS